MSTRLLGPPGAHQMSMEMTYEDFVRDAFTLATNRAVGQGGDPPGLASTAYFTARRLVLVKTAVIYAMEIFRTRVVNSELAEKLEEDALDEELTRLETFVPVVDEAASLGEIDAAIQNFRDSVIKRYFGRDEDGTMFLKPSN